MVKATGNLITSRSSPIPRPQSDLGTRLVSRHVDSRLYSDRFWKKRRRGFPTPESSKRFLISMSDKHQLTIGFLFSSGSFSRLRSNRGTLSVRGGEGSQQDQSTSHTHSTNPSGALRTLYAFRNGCITRGWVCSNTHEMTHNIHQNQNTYQTWRLHTLLSPCLLSLSPSHPSILFLPFLPLLPSLILARGSQAFDQTWTNTI